MKIDIFLIKKSLFRVYYISMNDPLGKISILLLLFYMGWYILDQNKLIENQNQKIQQMQQQLMLDEMIFKQYQNEFKTKNIIL